MEIQTKHAFKLKVLQAAFPGDAVACVKTAHSLLHIHHLV